METEALWILIGLLIVLILTIWKVGTLIVEQLKRIVDKLGKTNNEDDGGGRKLLVQIREPGEAETFTKDKVTDLNQYKRDRG